MVEMATVELSSLCNNALSADNSKINGANILTEGGCDIYNGANNSEPGLDDQVFGDLSPDSSPVTSLHVASKGDMTEAAEKALSVTPPSAEMTTVTISEGTVAGQRMRSCRSMSELEQELLAQLEAANQALELDNKSIQNVSPETDRKGGRDGDRKNSSDTASLRSVSSQSSHNTSTDHFNNIVPELEEQSPEQEAVHTWSKLLIDWENVVKKRQQYIKDLVYKGVPHQLRCLAWQHLCGAENSPYKEKYSSYLKQTSACEKVIRRDIARTYPEHEFFMEKDGLGQESLFNVMKAYSLHDREVGYCQGSGFIVGLLLMLMPEEETFSVLIQIMVEYRMRELFKPSMAELGICMYQLEYLIQEHSPPLYQHFQAQSLHTSMYASSWFLTLFTTQLPLELCFRIMDMFLFEGMEVIFRIGVALLLQGEADLLCMDMEGMLLYFQEQVAHLYADPESAQSLVNVATHQVKYNAKRIKKLEKEYSLLKSKENEDQVELRRLRSENRLLRQRIENLEKENVTLADRLIQGQVTLAQEAEVMFSVKRELSQLREQNKELYRSLSASEEQITELKCKKQGSDTKDGLYSNVRDLRSALNNFNKSTISVVSGRGDDDVESNDKFQALQEELIAVKLREAESNLALRELANHVTELDKEWQKQLERTPKDKLSKTQTQALHEELMSSRLRVAESNTSNKQLRLRVMELETGGQITANQVHRLMDDNEKLRADISAGREREQTLSSELQEFRNKVTEIDSKSKEEAMISKINDAEQSQLVAELRQRIAELEISNQEFQTTREITNEPGTPTPAPHQITEERIPFNRNSMTFSTLDIHKGADFDSGSDGDESGKHNGLGLTLSNSSGKSVVNGVDNSSIGTSRSKQLTSMEMDT